MISGGNFLTHTVGQRSESILTYNFNTRWRDNYVHEWQHAHITLINILASQPQHHAVYLSAILNGRGSTFVN